LIYLKSDPTPVTKTKGMNPNLFIRFKGIDPKNDSAVDLAELGESLTGFDSLFKSFGEILRINDTLEIKATATKEGCSIRTASFLLIPLMIFSLS